MKKITKIDENLSVKTVRKKRVAAYCRVSTAQEAQLVSLEMQKSHYKDFISKNPDWELVEVYYDEGISGLNKEKRPALMRMITDCENGKIDMVVTKSISRFSRNTADCLELVRKLQGLNIPIYFEKENIDTSSMESELLLSILSSLAEDESFSISQNSKWSVRNRFMNGKFKISSPPYGYDWKDEKMVLNSEQASVVKRIFRETLQGKSTSEIAQELQTEGIPTKRGGIWNSSTILAILRNEKYTGDVLFQKTYTDSTFTRRRNHGEKDQFFMENHHEAIVSHEEFKAANAVVEENASEKGLKGNTEKFLNHYVFSGKIICGHCGDTFKRRIHYSDSSCQYIAWCCSTHLKEKNKCSMLFIREDSLKAAFVTMMNKLIFAHEQILDPLLEAQMNTEYKQTLVRLDALEKRMDKNTQRRQSMVQLLSKGLLEPAVYARENNALIQEAKQIADEQGRLTHNVRDGMDRVTELRLLIQYTEQSEMIKEFSDEAFSEYVEKVIIPRRDEAQFVLKCGLKLTERLV